MGCIHFDAHADTLDTLLGKINHGTPFRRAVEEELIDSRRMIQIGLRGTRYSDEDIAFGYDVGMRLITMDDFVKHWDGPRSSPKRAAWSGRADLSPRSTSTGSIPSTPSARGRRNREG